MKNYIFLLALLTSFSTSFAESQTEPLELQKIMKSMGQDMQNITAAISSENWSAIKQSALNIADHPQPPFTEKVRILAYIGTRVSEFKNHDEATHNTARALSELAEKHDGEAIIDKFAELQKSCLSCHLKFRTSFKEHFYQP